MKKKPQTKHAELKRLVDIQRTFQRNFYDPDNLSDKERVERTKEVLLALHGELQEVLDCLPWKTHRKNNELIVRSNIQEEIIDCFKFILNLCIIWEMDEKIISREFDRKTLVVLQRYNQEILDEVRKYHKICALDLDDVLCQWSELFLKEFNKKFRTKYTSYESLKKEFDPLKFEEFKVWWRESGIKLKIKPMPYAKELTQKLRLMGYKIVIISSRPYRQFSRIYPDTIQWLRKNGILYDCIFFSEHKHIKILKELPQLAFMIEDRENFVRQVAQYGYKVFWMTRDSRTLVKNAIKINKLQDIFKHL